MNLLPHLAAARARLCKRPQSLTRGALLALGLACATVAAGAAPQPTKLKPTVLAPALARNAALPAAPLLAEDDFTRPARVRSVMLAPDGTGIAYIEQDGEKATLMLLDTMSQARKALLPLTGRVQPHWSGDSRTLFLVGGGGISTVSVADGASARIAVLDKEREQRFIAVDSGRPRHVLVQERDPASGQHRVLRMGADGASQVLYAGQARPDDFLLDADGKLDLIRTRDAGFDQVVRQRRGDAWQEVARCKPYRACGLVARSPDGHGVIMKVNHEDDRKALVRVDLRGKGQQLLHSDPQALADLGDVTLTPEGQPLLASYDMPARRNYGLTPASARAAARLARHFPESNLHIDAGTTGPWLLAERGARLSQTRHWLYDVERDKLTPVLEQERQRARPLPEKQLAAKIALHYPASDGALVHGYLSLPPGKEARGLPMLTMIHGGPWSEVDNGYSALVQTLVNRGYAVFQPNFRASTGYGDRYMLAPGADFGNGRVQADITDGVRWLMAQGVGDPKRQGVLGASFGGYSTLLALTHTPELFRFGMATQPPADFVRTMRLAAAAPAAPGEPPFGAMLAEMGIRLDDAAQMRRIDRDAPHAHTDKLRRPLLIIAGAKDEMVEIASVVDYVARLQGQDKPVSLLIDPDEGHRSYKPIARRAQMHLLLSMMQRYLGGPALPEPDAELAAYLARTMKVNGALP